MDELIYEPVRVMLTEQRPKWSYVFEDKMLKINTNDNFVDHEILRYIQDMGFWVNEIGYMDKFGIIFSVVEKNLT